jgi:heme exporter protein A
MQEGAMLEGAMLEGAMLEGAMLEGTDLACIRGDRLLFSGLDLRLAAGECLLVEGENGSGKTSLLRLLAGLARPSAGGVLWRGRGLPAWGGAYGAEMAYLGHKGGVKRELSALDNLRFQAILGGRTDAPDLLKALARVGLAGFEDEPVGHLSAGQERRVAYARLLVRRPPLWILDEPLTALDRAGCALITGLLAEHLRGGGVAVLTSHQPLHHGDGPGFPMRQIHLPVGEAA